MHCYQFNWVVSITCAKDPTKTSWWRHLFETCAKYTLTMATCRMMALSNGSLFRVNCLLCGETTEVTCGPHKGLWRGAFMFTSICAWRNVLINNRDTGDLKRHCTHYDVTVMFLPLQDKANVFTNTCTKLTDTLFSKKICGWPLFTKM